MTGAVSSQNAGTSTSCAGRSLSSAHASVEVPHRERPAGHQDLGGQRGGVRRSRRWGRRGQHRLADPQLVGGQHRLVVLLLVLDDHPEHEPALDQRPTVQRGPLEQVEHPAADLGDVPPRLRRGRAAAGAGRSRAGCWKAS